MKNIRVLIADDHAVVRMGLAAMLELESDIEVVGQAKNGNEAVGACVYRFNSDMKGAVVVSSRGRMLGSSDEKTQGKYLAKAIQIAAKKGVEGFFIYEFKAPENDPYYSEDHFGIVHRDFTPKAAYSGLKKGLTDPQIRKTLLEKE